MAVRVLLTGGSGMVGRNFQEHDGARSLDIAAPRSRELDLRSFPDVLAFVQDLRPDIVIHAAGRVGGIQANIEDPLRFYLENLDMGRNIVIASRDAGVGRLVNLGSSCMYPRNVPNPLREEAILTGELEPTNEGYALAKIATAKLCEYISRDSDRFSFKTLIPCNLYGRYDSFDEHDSHLIAAIIRKIHDARESGAESVEIWGDGTARREFMFAGDLADCIVQAIEQFDTLPALMNVGAGRDYSVNEYYEAVADQLNYKGTFTHDLDRPVGMQQKLTAVDKATKWGWQSQTSLQQGLAATCEYYVEMQGR